MKPRTSLVRTAWHEAGHAVAAVRLRGKIGGPVSIEQRHHYWNGVAFVGPSTAQLRDWAALNVAAPTPMWPARLRRSRETAAMILLAGRLAEDLIPYGADDDFAPQITELLDAHATVGESPAVVAPVATPPPLTVAEQELLQSPPPATDDEQVEAVCFTLAGDRWRSLRVWLRAETDYLLRLPPVRDQVEALALELLRHRTLSARAVRAVLATKETTYANHV